jgi:hypothetical protein
MWQRTLASDERRICGELCRCPEYRLATAPASEIGLHTYRYPDCPFAVVNSEVILCTSAVT